MSQAIPTCAARAPAAGEPALEHSLAVGAAHWDHEAAADSELVKAPWRRPYRGLTR